MSEPTPLPPPKESSAAIAARAALGFVVYLACGVVNLVGGPNIRPGIVPVLVPLLLLIVASIYLAITRKFRGFALGVFLGVGVTLIVMGVCFLAGVP